MRFAIPTAQGKLCSHFGHCETFTLFDVEQGSLSQPQMLVPPPHEPGLLPRWLKEQGVTHVIAGGMGGRARQLFEEAQIEVAVGAPVDDPSALVRAYLDKTLVTGVNTCDH